MASSVCAWVPCSTPFDARKAWQRFCSDKCRIKFANERRHQGLKLLREAMAAPLELAAAMPGAMMSSTAVSS